MNSKDPFCVHLFVHVQNSEISNFLHVKISHTFRKHGAMISPKNNQQLRFSIKCLRMKQRRVEGS